MKPKSPALPNLTNYFTQPKSQRQKQYEAVRALIMENLTADAVAEKFGYKPSSVYSLLRDAKAGRIELFPAVQKGPRQRRTSPEMLERIVSLRRRGLSTVDIAAELLKHDLVCSERTIERVIKDAGFTKLERRSNKERGISKMGKTLPERAAHLDFSALEPFSADCPVAGAFFFLPYVLESGVVDIVKDCALPESSDIGAAQACLSMLLLKLIGCDRLSHIGAYDKEPGLAVFAGLNVLPKPTYMNTYSCRSSEDQLMKFQQKTVQRLSTLYPKLYCSDFINLDFHSIPHYGEESEMEKVWCGARGRAMKGANTIIAQDSQSKSIIYTRADILRNEESAEIQKFVSYWKEIKGSVEETLVFDCKLTTYSVLDELASDDVNFITLRKRNAALVSKTLAVADDKWQKVHVPIPKRKHDRVSVWESEVKLSGCKNAFRQLAIKDHGRSQPTFILTNNMTLELSAVLEVYAKRWRVENKIAELVSFFNLNALSSPIMIRIHFDLLWTVIADTLYHRLAQDLRRHEKALAPQLFRKFIDIPGRIVFDGNRFFVKIRKRAHTPILKGVEKLQKPFKVPWLDNRTVEVVWTA